LAIANSGIAPGAGLEFRDLYVIRTRLRLRPRADRRAAKKDTNLTL